MDKLLGYLQKFVDANKMVKQCCPDDWNARMRIYRLMINTEMQHGRGPLEAAIVLASKYTENDNTRLWILATAVEMIEEG